MNHDQFIYWLQGFVEMNGGKQPTEEQWKMITDHLKLCFNKVTPTYYHPTPSPMPSFIPALQPPFKITCGHSVHQIFTPATGGVIGGES